MKKIFLALSAALFALLSCERMEEVATPEGQTDTMSISASLDEPLKTVIGASDAATLSVMFTSSDKLLVYGKQESTIKGVSFSTSEEGCSKSKTFTTESWPEGYTPIYAVATTSTSTLNTCTEAGVIQMNVGNARQRLDRSNSYASNSTVHVGQVEGNSVVLKNVCSLVGFKVSGKDDIVRIDVLGNNDEYLGGWISVDCSKITSGEQFYTVTNGVKRITVTAADVIDGNSNPNGYIPSETTFYISLLPGTYSNGLTLVMTDKDGKVAKRVINSSLVLNRAKARSFSTAINQGLEFKAVEMPSEISFKFGTKWPLTESVVAAASQSAEGDNYTYDFIDSESGWSASFPFVIFKGSSNYTQTTQSLEFKGTNSWMKLPAISGRVLKSVTVKVRNSTAKAFNISATAGGTAMKSGSVKSGATLTLSWAESDENKPEANTSYYLNVPGSSTYCTEIIVIYGQDASAVQYPAEFTVDLNLTSWPFTPACVAEEDQALTGEAYSYQFSGTIGGKSYSFPVEFVLCKGPNGNTYSIASSALSFKRVGSNPYKENLGYIKLPAIPGRYLKQVNLTITTISTDVVLCKKAERETEGENLVKQFRAYKTTDSSSGALGNTVANTSYYLYRLSTTAFNMTNLKVTYATPAE